MSNNSSTLPDFAPEIPEAQLSRPSLATVLKLIWFSIRNFFKEPPGIIIFSTCVLLILWGFHGGMEWLRIFCKDWYGPGLGPECGPRPQLIPGIPWDNELISFWGGAFLLVVIPILIIKFLFRERLSDYGLGLPPKGRRVLALWSFLILLIVCLPFFWWYGTHDLAMRSVYPIYRPFSGGGAFILYELTYLPFFLAIEFIFRGYLLFGLAAKRIGKSGAVYAGFGNYALLISMLSYVAWHLGKPSPEVWGTLIWGFAAGAAIYATRSIWPIVIAHWLLNVFMDALIAKPF